MCELLLGPIPAGVPALVLQPGIHPGADSSWCAHPPNTLALLPSQGHQVRYLKAELWILIPEFLVRCVFVRIRIRILLFYF